MKFYLISPNKECNEFNPCNLNKIADYINIDYLQLRPKLETENENVKFIEKNFKLFFEICKKRKIKFILNDNILLAKKLNFDGVHLGQTDMNCFNARKILGKKKIIGISCNNSIKLAKQAEKEGANYVAFGPAFSSKTKKSNKPIINKNHLKKQINILKIPFTIIGGIDHKNFFSLHKLKPNNIAIINSIWKFSKGSVEAAKLFSNLILKN